MMTISDNKLKIFGLILLIIALFLPALQAKYLWPLPASRELTSGFCAYRSGHYHAGIDIRTFGKTGYNAVAVEDGYLWRVASNWWGYGNVVYVKLSDGNIAVYAHLNEFTPEVEAYVRQKQREAGRFKVNLFPDSGQFKFKKGDLIGKTGQSGVGAPHLHFEIRTAGNEAVSPLAFYPELKDGRAPRFEEITFVPLRPGSYVDGASIPKSYKFKYSKENNNYYISEIPKLSGNVGLEVKVADRRSGVERKYNVSELQLFLEDSLIFQIKYDTLSFDSWGLVDSDYNHYQRIDGKSYYHNLYSSRASSPFHSTSQNPSYDILNPVDKTKLPGVLSIKLVAKDFNGKIREGLFQIEKKPALMLTVNEGTASDDYLRERPVMESANSSDSIKPEFNFKLEDQSYSFYSGSPVKVILNVYNPEISNFSVMDSISLKREGSEYNNVLHTSNIYDKLNLSDNVYDLLRLDFYNAEGIFESKLMGISEKVNIRYFADKFDYDIDFIDSIYFIRSNPRVSIDMKKLYDFFINNNFHANFMQSIDIDNRVSFNLWLNIPRDEFVPGKTFTPLINALCMKKLLSENYYLSDKLEHLSRHDNLVNLAFARHSKNVCFFQMLQNTNGVEIIPDDRLLDPAAELYLKLPDGSPSEKSALYGMSRAGEPGFIANDFDSLGRVGGKIRSFGTYRVMVDSSGPLISNISPHNGQVINTSRPRISFRMKDDLSGFSSDTLLVVTLDGKYLVSEYDVDNLIVYSYLNNKLTPGSHKLEIIARDRLGNTTVESTTFRYQVSQ